MIDSLLGDRHSQLVAELLGRLAAVVSGDVSARRVVVLEGASGTGKSRIVREVYRRLQAIQPSPAYWPPLPEQNTPSSGGSGLDPMPDRKRLGPPVYGFLWPAEALPSFGWWVLDCDRLPQGDLLDVISQARPYIATHLLPVRLAWRDAAGWPARLRSQRSRLLARAREALIEGGLEGIDQLLSTPCGSTTSPATPKSKPASMVGRESAASSTTSGHCSVDRTFSTFSPTGQRPARSSPVASRSRSRSPLTNHCHTEASPPALRSTPDGPLAGRLRTEHEIAMRDLYYGTNEPPTFDEVLDRVHASRALLDIEIAS